MSAEPPIPLTLAGILRKLHPFVTCESGGADCRGKVVFRFDTLENAQAFHEFIVKLDDQPTPDSLPDSWETLARNIREIISSEAKKGGSVFDAVDAVVRELTSGNRTPDRGNVSIWDATGTVTLLEQTRLPADASTHEHIPDREGLVGTMEKAKHDAPNHPRGIGFNEGLDSAIGIVRQHQAARPSTPDQMLNSIADAIIEADKPFAGPCMILKREEAEAYARAAIPIVRQYETAMGKDDYLYESDGGYNPRMVKKIFKAAKSKSVAVFSGSNAAEDFMRWLEDAPINDATDAEGENL